MAEIPQTRKGNSKPILYLTSRFQSSITLSGFLNALDGVVASEERIIFMTTNHPEKLDPALIRPGRVDMKEYFGHATEHQMKEMFLRFYGGPEPRAAEFAKTISASGQVSTAFLQGLFVSNKEQPERALQEAQNLSIKDKTI
jgi:mitochondrial chaperone BCS1